jgi:hypothetical protein
MNKFVLWYRENYKEITWFLIGFLVMGGLHDLQRGNLTGALLSFGLAGVNIWLERR